jgi:hypothetical protein
MSAVFINNVLGYTLGGFPQNYSVTLLARNSQASSGCVAS